VPPSAGSSARRRISLLRVTVETDGNAVALIQSKLG
jgi:hypothetical protein